MAIHRHRRIDQHGGVVLGRNDVEGGEGQIGVVRNEAVVVEGGVLVQWDVELGAQPLAPFSAMMSGLFVLLDS
jgi:hypothetical protein